ncbi:MAG: DUF4166 domain-containing protein [Rhodobacteraceae bacterium]|nr:DUF4166 domain-containing protein [Paracoccaceae bacterium]
MKLLILGGYGVFGGRLAELLSDIPDVEILIGGRNLNKAKAFCAAASGSAVFTPAKIDRSGIASALADHRPDILVDASGPFQSYGAEPYSVVRACITAGVHYLDFADAADFVFGIQAFDADARKAGVFILSGVSSFPVLTAAVLRELSTDMEITGVTGGIAPSPYAGIGLNVVRAVVGYAGSPLRLTRGGRPATATGLAESRRFTIAPPGLLPLRNLRFSLVDVPDLQVLPPEHPTLADIWMGAGTVPESLHRILNLLAKTRALLRLPPLIPLAPLFHRVLNLMKFGEHRGGMFVEVRGNQAGVPVTKSWHLLAEGDDGPYIPSMAIEAILRKWLAGDAPEIGARAATRSLSLADYDVLFKNRDIYTGLRSSASDIGSLYQRVLGPAFDCLPPQLQALHSPQRKGTWSGRAAVTRGNNPLAHLIAKLIGFPAATADIPVSVTFTPVGTGEVWQRRFGGKIFRSIQDQGSGRDAHLLTEKFGPVTVSLALVVKDDRLCLIPRRWSVLGLPMPKFLLPGGKSFERERDGVFQFDVTVRTPVAGLIVAYQGWLKPQT